MNAARENVHVLTKDASDGETLGVVAVAHENVDVGMACEEEAEELLK